MSACQQTWRIFFCYFLKKAMTIDSIIDKSMEIGQNEEKGVMKLDKLTAETMQLIEEMALHHENQGLSRIAGRIIGLLMVSQEPLSSEQIATTLQVSLGSVSTNMRILLKIGIAEKKSVTGDRVSYYIVAPDAIEEEFIQGLERILSLKNIIEKGMQIENLKESELVMQRFHEMLEAIELYRESLNQMLAKWKSRRM
ncbi:GbsR/MarR family transcriptional regulator [Brevibacillus formosus]